MSTADIIGFFLNIFTNIWIYISIVFWGLYYHAKRKKNIKQRGLWLLLAIIFSVITLIAAFGIYFI